MFTLTKNFVIIIILSFSFDLSHFKPIHSWILNLRVDLGSFPGQKGHFTHLNTPIFPTFVFSVCIISNRSTKFGRQKWLWALSPVNRLRPTGLSRRFSEISYLKSTYESFQMTEMTGITTGKCQTCNFYSRSRSIEAIWRSFQVHSLMIQTHDIKKKIS